MFAKMKLRQRILLGYLVPVLLLAAVMTVAYSNARTAALEIAELNETAPFVADVLVASGSLVRMQRASFAHVLTNGGAYKGGSMYPKKIYSESALKFQEITKKLERSADKVGQRDALRQMTTIGNNIAQVTQHYIELIAAGKEKEAITEVRRGESIRLSSQIDPLVDTIVRTEEARRNHHRAELTRTIDEMQNTVVAGTLLAIVLMVALGLWLAYAVSRNITANATQLSAAASEIAATITQHERTASQQAAAANETSATIDELSASSRKSAEQAASAAAVAEKAGAATSQGDEATRQAVLAMAGLKDKIGAMAEQILHLGEQTGQIGNIATVLKDLAGQINMLALNAAVEAARAGEHGKGFAVVAGEIRKLADESKKSAEQTAVLVADTQKATNSSIMMTEEGTRTVAEVTQLVQKVAELFVNLASLADSANENAQQVMLNARQQSAAFSQVVEATTSIASGARETAAGISQTKIGVQQLNEAADNLKAIA
ncbi:methyl-accepting chemotaxis protein [Sulfuritalea sp.]|uniref:methyl-accepting chemotaxis protein n=1 Tax=Sulfuritalea sp. TaxID=2480090 RepID=UPI00286E469C|nr:methyl-accepting chemotaxis protein [Sulfuritalea sp.]